MTDKDSEQPRLDSDCEKFGPAPFDGSSTGDCILQGPDGTKYKTHRVILALASSVFRDMWEVGTGGPGIPTIELTESSDVVHNLLLHIHPTTTPYIDKFALALSLLDACDKYLIDHRGFLPHLARTFQCPWFRQSEGVTLDAYCLAWRLNMRERSQRLSRYLHGLDLTRPGLHQEISKKAGDVGALLALWDLRHRREVAIDPFIEQLPIDLYRCRDHQKLTLEEVGRLRRNVRKALKDPWLSFDPRISGHLELFSVLEMPGKAPRSANRQQADKKKSGASGRGLRRGNLPCPACLATVINSRSGELNTRKLLDRAAMDIPLAITWPSDKPAIDYI
ncbi:hypothetical protein FRC01_005626 [Tulasnella sp. 417]|nr:hypothetical protein FRC01_005626 [Tulasnella sp. 417]